MDEWIDSDEQSSSEDEDGEGKSKEDSDDEKDKKAKHKKMAYSKKKKRGVDEEAFEESDDGDEEGRELHFRFIGTTRSSNRSPKKMPCSSHVRRRQEGKVQFQLELGQEKQQLL